MRFGDKEYPKEVPKKLNLKENCMSKVVFGAGCFWGVEKKFSELRGVVQTEVGYSQGNSDKTTYEEVCTGNTNHVEVVLVKYDEEIIKYEELINFFFEIHDPTTLNQQGPDRGSQYRSLIGCFNENQIKIAEVRTKFLNENSFNNKITTTIESIHNYCPAEEYHQKYIEKNR